MKNKFIQDWKQEKQLDVYRELREELKNKLTKENTPPPIPISIAQSHIYAKEQRQSVGLLTGYKIIDDPELLGGLHRGSIYVIGGLTGVGKTLFACNIVMKVCLTEIAKTLFVTTEMPHYTITPRLFDIWQNFLADEENFRELPVFYIDQKETISTDLIENLLAMAAKEEKPYQFLVVDNLQWFTRGGANVPESIGLAMQALKKMAIKYDIPILVVSHLNRDTYHQDHPELNNLKGGSYIEQDADAVILLSRSTDPYQQDEFANDVIVATIRKNRLTGGLHRSYMRSEKTNLSLKEIEKWEAQLR